MKKIYQYLLFIGTLLLMLLPEWYWPVVQKEAARFQAKQLGGEDPYSAKPVFWWSQWFNKSFQKAQENHVKNENPLRPFAVILKTQLDYSLFDDLPHANILSGKDGYLYTKTGCEAHVGKTYNGGEAIAAISDKLHYIIRYYADRNIPFLILMPPAKPTIIPEYMPDFYQNYPIDSTNRMGFRHAFEQRGIPFMDFEYLKDLRDTCTYPLYSKGGLHWSYYTMAMVTDTILGHWNTVLDHAMPLLHWRDSIVWTSDLRGPDKELVVGANFYKDPTLAAMPYPQMRYITDSLHQKPRALVVGDSYYKLMYDYGIPDGIFAEGSTFWYYNREIHPPMRKDGQQLSLDQLDFLAEIESRDLVMLVVYEANLDRFAFNFIEKVYELLQKRAKN